jgi:hypothetical protein
MIFIFVPLLPLLIGVGMLQGKVLFHLWFGFLSNSLFNSQFIAFHINYLLVMNRMFVHWEIRLLYYYFFILEFDRYLFVKGYIGFFSWVLLLFDIFKLLYFVIVFSTRWFHILLPFIVVIGSLECDSQFLPSFCCLFFPHLCFCLFDNMFILSSLCLCLRVLVLSGLCIFVFGEGASLYWLPVSLFSTSNLTFFFHIYANSYVILFCFFMLFLVPDFLAGLLDLMVLVLELDATFWHLYYVGT